MTLSERYGIPADETVPDDRWLREAGERGEAVFKKDARIRYRSAEKAALVTYAVRCFCLTGGNLTGDEMAACGEPGPFLYAVQRQRSNSSLCSAAAWRL